MLGYLSADIICSEKQAVFQEHNPRRTASFEEQIRSKDKYQSIFLLQIEAIEFSTLQIVFCSARSFENWGIFSDIPQFFGHVTFRPIACERKYLMDYNEK